MRISKQISKGFSLIELLVSVVIIGVISMLSIIIFTEGTNIYFDETASKRVVDEARLTFWKVSQHVRGIPDRQSLASSSDRILYTSPNNDAIQVEASSGNLVLVDQSSEYLLSDRVDFSNQCEFSYIDQNGNALNPSGSLSSDNANNTSLIKVDLRFKEVDKSIDFSSHFYPRNFRYGNKMSYHD